MAGISLSTCIPAIGLIGIGLLPFPLCRASASQAYYDEAWLKINQYSPVEGFESHGSFGWHVGVGLLQIPHSRDLADSDLYGSVDTIRQSAPPERVPRIFLTRGTPWPLDFGVSLTRLEHQTATQIGGHVQWTLFEDFKKPALALRLAHMQTQGLSGLEQLQSDSVILGISYGFWRYLNVGLGIGRQQHRLAVKPIDEANVFGLRGGWEETIDKTESIWTVNVKINLLSPFLCLGIERIHTHPREALTLAKISYML